MYIFFIVLIIIASILIILAVLAQNPKSGMAANFGASNQVMGVRQTTDFLEKFTWTMAISIFVLSLLASIAISSHRNSSSGHGDEIIEQITTESTATIPNQVAQPVTPDIPAEKTPDNAPAATEE